jgi:hypothetical protein
MNSEARIIYDPRGNMVKEELINQGYKVEILDLTVVHPREGQAILNELYSSKK